GAGRERDPRVRGDDPAQAGLLGRPSWARPGARASRTARGGQGGLPEGAGGGDTDGRPSDEEGDGGVPPAPGPRLTEYRDHHATIFVAGAIAGRIETAR